MNALLASLQRYWPVHLLLAAYTLVLAWHAWSGSRRTRGIGDYYVGGRTMGGVALGLSFFATYSSTNSFVGFAGQAYAWGVAWTLLAPMAVLMSFVAWRWVAPRLRRFTVELGSLTVPDFIGFRFHSTPARVLAAAIVLFASLFYMTAVFKGIGNLVEVFLQVPYEAAILLVFLVVMAYTMAGGFISVVKTDAVQGLVMVVAAAVLFAGTVRAAGGLGALAALQARPATRWLFDLDGALPFAYVLGVLFAGTIKFVAEPRQLSRFYALRSDAAARTGVIVSTLCFAFVYSLLVPLGLYARAIWPEGIEETDRIVPLLLTTPGVFGEGATAFLMLAMIAAAMSSLDSVLLVMASTAERDLVGVWRGAAPERAELRRTRVWVVVFAALTALIALRPPGGIVALTVLSGSVYAACFLPAVVLGLTWRGGNGAGVVGSFAAGLAALVIWPRTPWAGTVHAIFPAVAGSVFVYLLAARRGGAVSCERLDRLFAHRAS